MKLRVYIAGRYRKYEIPAIRAANPSYNELDATKHFVEEKYGAWISENMDNATHEYLIENVCVDYFDIDFTYKDDAEEFRKLLGGNYL
ncbi:hypothetical protein [Agrobacterium tumefaciens]|uniref:hypothetical protein n=1 Tax=Agrobacterium tumefaciens TaxID=358 RepID=UPI00101A7D57|nr:hypothetical protein [Agrobacterium tumefaciens]UXS04520.1 hypothetical protein FY156_23965 [Agrobacterium tumefaciens]